MIFFCGSVYFGQLISAKLKKDVYFFFQSRSVAEPRLRNPELMCWTDDDWGGLMFSGDFYTFLYLPRQTPSYV
jgi:hypothetical protein